MDLTEAFVKHENALRRLNRSDHTIKAYKVYKDAFLVWLEEHGLEDDLEALNPQFVREFQGWLRARSTGSRGGLAAEKQAVVVLKVVSHWMWEQEYYAVDPLARLKRPKVPKVHRKPFTEQEAKRLVSAALDGPTPLRDRAMILLLFDTGARVGELCGIERKDVDWDRGAVLLRKTKGGHPRTVIFRVGTERGGGRCMQALKQWDRTRNARPGVEALFTTVDGYGISTRRVRERFKELGELARVPDCHPHRCRHSAATELLADRPGAENQLRSRLGHLSGDILADYITLSDRTKEEIAEAASLSTKWKL